jgi:hypothetical protein
MESMKRYAHFTILEGQPHVFLKNAANGWQLPESPLCSELYSLDPVASSEEELVYWRMDQRLSIGSNAGEWIPWAKAESFQKTWTENSKKVLRNAVRLSGRRIVCAITGRKSTSPRYNQETAHAAFIAGKVAAELGLAVLTGGLSGVMERGAEGAKSVDGTSIGILPGNAHIDGNAHLDFVLPSGMGIARNCLIATACDLMLALPGGTGTLEEICFALDFDRPVLSWGSWEIDGVRKIEYPNEAILKESLREAILKMFDEYHSKKESV